MTRYDETQLSATTNTEISITIQTPCKADGRNYESLSVTFTTEFEFEVDIDHSTIKGEINRIVGEDDLASALARLLALGDLAIDPQILDRPDSGFLTLGTPEQPIHMTVNDSKGQPIRYLKGHEDELDWERTKRGRLRSRSLAVLLVAILEKICSRYRVELEVLSSFFRNQFISPRDAAIFCQGCSLLSGRLLRRRCEGGAPKH